MENLNLIISGVIGAGVASLLNFIINRKKEGRNDFQSIIETYREDNNRLRIKEALLETRVDKLEKELNRVMFRLQIMESAHYDLPIPAWLKDTNGMILSINKPYEEIFLEPLGYTADDYIGKSDIEVWGEKIGKEYQENDARILRNKRHEIVLENVMLLGGNRTKYRILKYPRYAGKTVIGIAGIALEEIKNE